MSSPGGPASARARSGTTTARAGSSRARTAPARSAPSSGSSRTSVWKTFSKPDPAQGQEREQDTEHRRDSRARRGVRRQRARAARGSAERRARSTAAAGVAALATCRPARAPTFDADRSAARAGSRRLDRALVDRSTPARDLRPGEVLGALARPATPICARRAGSSHSERSASASSSGSPCGDEHAVAAVRDDVAVAGDVGCDHRRAGRERLGQHHAEALAAQRRRAQHVGAVQPAPKLVVVHAPEHARCRPCRPRPRRAAARPRRRVAPTTAAAAGMCWRRPANADSRIGRPLRSSSRPTNTIRKRVGGGLGPARRRRRGRRRWGSPRTSPPKKRSPVQRAASETAMRPCSRLKRRRAPMARAIVFGSQLVE